MNLPARKVSGALKNRPQFDSDPLPPAEFVVGSSLTLRAFLRVQRFQIPIFISLRTGSQRGWKKIVGKKFGERVGACALPPHQTALGSSRSP